MTSFYFFSNFGQLDSRNGQVQKALSISSLLQTVLNGRCQLIDVGHHWWYLLRLLHLASDCCVFGSLGRNGIRAFAIAYVCARAVRFRRGRMRLYFFVVGGWIAELATRDPLIRSFLRSCSGVLVETQALANDLSSVGVRASVFPNFRILAEARPKAASENVLRLCFCSRIRADKGPIEAIALARELNARGWPTIIDFYGPCDAKFRQLFFDACQESFVTYRGTYSDLESATQIMRAYDFLVLPTSYAGECVPGAVVEAFFAGTPVIVSDWRFMKEVVHDGQNGLVIPLPGFAETACRRVVDLLQNREYEHYSARAVQDAGERFSYQAAEGALRRAVGKLE